MKLSKVTRWIGACLIWLGATAASGQSFMLMNQIDPVGPNLRMTDRWGPAQIFPDYPAFSSTQIDDFVSGGGIVDQVEIAFYITAASLDFNNVQGWRVSMWTSPGDAANSGLNLDQNTVGTTLVPTSAVVVQEIFNTQAEGRTFRVTIPTALFLPPGVFWVGVAPILSFDPNGQTMGLSHSNPSQLGINPLNGLGVNPGEGFGAGRLITTNTNIAYSVRASGGSQLLEKVWPQDYFVRLGKRVGGDLQSLRGEDDDALRIARFVVPNLTSPGVVVDVVGQGVTPAYGRLELKTRSRMETTGGGFLQRLLLYDFRSGSFVFLKEMPLGTTYLSDSTEVSTDAMRFYSSDRRLMMRFAIYQTAPAVTPAWIVDLDNVFWELRSS
ncbi:MAG: hypothetical protein JSS66_16440 [Armatimonadetes bacterium]|nr:hypothetical protein [Armatimonadota bacterium]